MKKLSVIPIFALLLCLSSCQAIAGIFKAGVGVGIFLVILVIGIIIFIITRVSGK